MNGKQRPTQRAHNTKADIKIKFKKLEKKEAKKEARAGVTKKSKKRKTGTTKN